MPEYCLKDGSLRSVTAAPSIVGRGGFDHSITADGCQAKGAFEGWTPQIIVGVGERSACEGVALGVELWGEC